MDSFKLISYFSVAPNAGVSHNSHLNNTTFTIQNMFYL